jgi:cell division protein ZapA (FtsZ GTPase activity inhibitor)
VAKRSVAVRIRGQEFRVRSDEDEASLRRVASYLDDTMARVEERTGTVDSLGLAMVTALNLAREVLALRDGGVPLAGDAGKLRALIELAESALGSPAAHP